MQVIDFDHTPGVRHRQTDVRFGGTVTLGGSRPDHPRLRSLVMRGVIETALAVLLMAALGGLMWLAAEMVLR